jgi:hypothetical protein
MQETQTDKIDSVWEFTMGCLSWGLSCDAVGLYCIGFLITQRMRAAVTLEGRARMERLRKAPVGVR